MTEPSSIQGGDAAYELTIPFGPCSQAEAEAFHEWVSDFVLGDTNYGACVGLHPREAESVTPEGVADVLSEATIAELLADPQVSPESAARYLAVSHRVLALRCSEQAAQLDEALAAAREAIDLGRELRDLWKKAEARRVELEAAAEIIPYPDNVPQWGGDDWRYAAKRFRATLTPTVETEPES